MKSIKLQLTLLFSLIGFNFILAQMKGTVIDSSTQQPIPFVNIWVTGESIGTTSDENGQFILENIDTNKNIVFSVIGYQSLETTLQNGNNQIILLPKNIELETIVISATRTVTETKIGVFKKSKINFYYGSNAQPKIRARFFPFESNHENALIKSLSLNTRSEVKDARFHVRIYATNEHGQPGEFLHDKIIKGIAKKGNQATVIDIAHLNLTFPKSGIFIAVEWLIIEQNKYWSTGKDLETKKKVKDIAYAPLFGTTTSEQNENSWIFENGLWTKVEKNSAYFGKKERYKFNVLAMELVLIE